METCGEESNMPLLLLQCFAEHFNDKHSMFYIKTGQNYNSMKHMDQRTPEMILSGEKHGHFVFCYLYIVCGKMLKYCIFIY